MSNLLTKYVKGIINHIVMVDGWGVETFKRIDEKMISIRLLQGYDPAEAIETLRLCLKTIDENFILYPTIRPRSRSWEYHEKSTAENQAQADKESAALMRVNKRDTARQTVSLVALVQEWNRQKKPVTYHMDPCWL